MLNPSPRRPTFSSAGVVDSQRGVVLITALVFLILLTMLGLAVSRNTSIEEKLVRNFIDSDQAFAAAEAALRDAELHINGYYNGNPVNENGFTPTCTNGLCDDSVGNTQLVHQLDFFAGSGLGAASVRLGEITGSPSTAGIPVANQPRYLIEKLCRQVPGGSATGAQGCQTFYRITSQARGRFGGALVTLQEAYVP